jgi:hypothetical protein
MNPAIQPALVLPPSSDPERTSADTTGDSTAGEFISPRLELAPGYGIGPPICPPIPK